MRTRVITYILFIILSLPTLLIFAIDPSGIANFIGFLYLVLEIYVLDKVGLNQKFTQELHELCNRLFPIEQKKD